MPQKNTPYDRHMFGQGEQAQGDQVTDQVTPNTLRH